MRRLVVLGLLGALAAAAAAQEVPAPRDPRAREIPRGEVPRLETVPKLRPEMFDSRAYLQRNLAQIDQLLQLGYASRANALIDEAAAQGVPEAALLPRRVAVAQAMNDHAGAAALCRRGLATDPGDAQLWRELSLSSAAIGDVDSARIAADHFIALAPDPRTGFMLMVEQLQSHARHQAAVALLDSARVALGDPGFLARERATSLLPLGRHAEAAREIATDLRQVPFNLSLVRQQFLGTDLPAPPLAFVAALSAEARQDPPAAAVAAFAAGCRLRQGDGPGALAEVERDLAQPAGADVILRDASALTRELPLLPASPELNATADYLLAILPRLAQDQTLPARLRARAVEHLALVCETSLERGLLAGDPAAAADRFDAMLRIVASASPASEHLYAAEILLARFTRDQLRRPDAAAARLERLLLDLDLPLEGVALARLALGECYLAAGDTSRGRLVLTRLGRDQEFPQAAGHAHFDLARLDLAQGQFGTARDRFAAVALDDPAAPYANDALALGLIVAEEMQNPSGGEEMLRLYCVSVAHALAARPDSQRVALERYLDRAVIQLDLAKPQPLLEHARFELAHLYLASGQRQAALAQLDHIVADQPDGRYPAQALAERGRILAEAGDVAGARAAYERLLVQYPDYLFADEVRERVRSLP
jgi:tetratricopeptide (TPR) repeat protein